MHENASSTASTSSSKLWTSKFTTKLTGSKRKSVNSTKTQSGQIITTNATTEEQTTTTVRGTTNFVPTTTTVQTTTKATPKICKKLGIGMIY